MHTTTAALHCTEIDKTYQHYTSYCTEHSFLFPLDVHLTRWTSPKRGFRTIRVLADPIVHGLWSLFQNV